MPDVVDHGEAVVAQTGRAVGSAAARAGAKATLQLLARVWKGFVGLPGRYVRALQHDRNGRRKAGEVTLRNFTSLSQGPRQIISLENEEIARQVSKELQRHGMLWALERHADGGVSLHVREREADLARHAVQVAIQRRDVKEAERAEKAAARDAKTATQAPVQEAPELEPVVPAAAAVAAVQEGPRVLEVAGAEAAELRSILVAAAGEHARFAEHVHQHPEQFKEFPGVALERAAAERSEAAAQLLTEFDAAQEVANANPAPVALTSGQVEELRAMMRGEVEAHELAANPVHAADEDYGQVFLSQQRQVSAERAQFAEQVLAELDNTQTVRLPLDEAQAAALTGFVQDAPASTHVQAIAERLESLQASAPSVQPEQQAQAVPAAALSAVPAQTEVQVPDGPLSAATVSGASVPAPRAEDGPFHRLVSHGEAPYQHKPEGTASYFVTVEDENGKQRTHWGVGLREAMERSGVQPGDQIQPVRTGQVPVTLPDGTETHRNGWMIVQPATPPTAQDVQALNEQFAPDANAVPAPAEPSFKDVREWAEANHPERYSDWSLEYSHCDTSMGRRQLESRLVSWYQQAQQQDAPQQDAPTAEQAVSAGSPEVGSDEALQRLQDVDAAIMAGELPLTEEEAIGVAGELADLAAVSDGPGRDELTALAEHIRESKSIPARPVALQKVANAHRAAVENAPGDRPSFARSAAGAEVAKRAGLARTRIPVLAAQAHQEKHPVQRVPEQAKPRVRTPVPVAPQQAPSMGGM